jgi:hypothetical protein
LFHVLCPKSSTCVLYLEYYVTPCHHDQNSSSILQKNGFSGWRLSKRYWRHTLSYYCGAAIGVSYLFKLWLSWQNYKCYVQFLIITNIQPELQKYGCLLKWGIHICIFLFQSGSWNYVRMCPIPNSSLPSFQCQFSATRVSAFSCSRHHRCEWASLRNDLFTCSCGAETVETEADLY